MATAGQVPNTTVTEVEVFKQRSELRSWYADNRFKQLTLWFAAMTLLITAGYHHESDIALGQHPFIVPLLGILLTSAFWVMEVSSSLREIEAVESLKSYEKLVPIPTKLKNWTFFNHTNVTLLLYIVSFGFWTALVWTGLAEHVKLGKLTERCMATIMVAITVAGVVLLTYTVREYWYLWRNAKKGWKW
jgi:hypothetical protein